MRRFYTEPASAHDAADPTIAQHVSVRQFRAGLRGYADGTQAIVIGGKGRTVGVFIPVKVTTWQGCAEALKAARKVMLAVKSVERYRSEPNTNE